MTPVLQVENLRIGFRRTALVGASIILVGAVLMVLLSPSSSVAQVAATCFVVGLGMGLVASPTLIAAQSSVEWTERGVITGTNMFARSMGSALGIAVFGAIANVGLGNHVGGGGATTASGIAPSVMAVALQHVFLATAVGAVGMLAAVLLMPRRVETVG